MKTCKICKEIKEFSEFYTREGSRDGYRADCKICNLIQKKKNYIKNPSKAIERASKRYKEKAEQIKQYTKDWYLKNLEKNRSVRREYYKSNIMISNNRGV